MDKKLDSESIREEKVPEPSHRHPHPSHEVPPFILKELFELREKVGKLEGMIETLISLKVQK